jgi:hypothetical protein
VKSLHAVRQAIKKNGCRFFFFWQNLASPRSGSPEFAPCNFWLFPNLKSPVKGRRFLNATVTHYASSVNGVSLPTDQPHGRMTVHGCAVRSPLTRCEVTSRPRDLFSRYSKWLDTFRTDHTHTFNICYKLYLSNFIIKSCLNFFQ